jgi:WD40 repeat protein
MSAGLRFPSTTEVVPSADGRHAAVRRASGALERWDLDTLTMEPVVIESHVTDGDVAISDDGQRLATGTNDGALLVWTDPLSAPLVLGRGIGTIRSIAFSHKGVRIAALWDRAGTAGRLSGSTRRLRVWDVAAGRELIDVDVDPHRVAFDASGRHVLVVGSPIHTIERKRNDRMAWVEGPTCNTDTHDTLQVWDLESRQKTFGARQQCAHAAAFTPDGAFVAADSWQTPIVLHATDTGGIAMHSEEMPPVTSIAVSPDGSRLAIGTGESQVVVVDTATLEALLVIRVESQFTHRVMFSTDGTRLITSAFMAEEGTHIVHVYDARPPHEPAALIVGGAAKSVATGTGRD